MTYILAYDVGTTGIKTCLFELNGQIHQAAASNFGYGLYEVGDGGVEQHFDEWWEAMKITTQNVLERSLVDPSEIAGISFCSQMQGLVLVDEKGIPVRNPMSYMDQRGKAQIQKYMRGGLEIAGGNIVKLLKCLKYTGAAPVSVKDPVWKYKWVQENEPEPFARAYKWLDIKESIIARCTGECVMTEDSAFSTLLYDPKARDWAWPVVDMFGVKRDHLARIIKTTDVAGYLTEEAAHQLGLTPGTKVFGGGGDATLIGVGAGCVKEGDTHIYSGTSGWVSTIVSKQTVDTSTMIAAIVGCEDGLYNYFAEMETAGKCLEWVKDHLALDEIDIYLNKADITTKTESEFVYKSLYEYMTEIVKKIPAGSGGVLFTPWLHGNRCPFEDPNACGTFFGITMNTGKTELIRAVLEGVCYHLRWMLECEAAKVKTSDTIRFCGGGALPDVTCQILSDMTCRRVEVVDNPQDVGAVGAACTAAAGLGLVNSMQDIASLVPVEKSFEPNLENKKIYDSYFKVFKRLYRDNKANLAQLDRARKAAGIS